MVLLVALQLELEAVSTSQDETNRILALGLSHEENLVEATANLILPHMISVVTLQLTNARDEKIQAEIDLIESEKYSLKLVKVSDEWSQILLVLKYSK